MKVAIIGGGASGMTAAYYLNKNGHQVTVFEKQAILGGHIRTLNKNVKVNNLDPDIILEGGVVEFSSEFHTFLSLMKELEVELEPINVGSSIFNKEGKRYLSRTVIAKNIRGLLRIFELIKLVFVYLSAAGLWLTARYKKSSEFHGQSMAYYVKEHSIKNSWLKLLTMYCYSIPYKWVNRIPAELALSALSHYVQADWYHIKGGAYSYIEKILQQFNGEVVVNADISNISRSESGVSICIGNKQTEFFDKIIFAVPPDQVLKLLSDSTEKEQVYFRSWQENRAHTIVHTDLLIYKNYGISQASEFDFFQTKDGWGYNACLNRLCGLKASPRYNLSFNLDSLISKESIIYRAEHHTPMYTVKSFKYRDQIIADNGDNNTCHAGAYLYDGLHEGAIIAGKKAADLIVFQL
ncbi:MAG: FAD-dependent oxidoreductase [gamma proteobacterium symbiont of Taylorina sp.]|nr:FAD-dependent oxidoreductase [gamma proteobacterium symbiont of Taylorina sp.]